MTQISYPHKVELLAPAGSREALTGAFSAGADAVYLGGERFGARAYADNFSTEEIIRSIGEAHVLDRKVYLTANVLTREDELADLVSFVRQLDDAGLDGVIVQDIGVLSALHEACPHLPLHASTQMSVTSSDAVRLLRRLGVCRVVPARELSLKEIETLRREDAAVSAKPIEIEAFIHGAMCYSYSGRCLMSSFLGGRSGNRGRCAGTCRLPFRILDENRKPAGPDARRKEVWPLSMKDMCVLSILPELIDAGIDSFKIEGRMKKPVYAAGVTAIYRKYIDRCYAWMEAGRPSPWAVEEEDLDRLRSLYIRTGLGTGYYHTKNGRNLVTIGKPGYAGTDAALEEEIRRQYLGRLPAREIMGKAVFRTGEPARLTVMLPDRARKDPGQEKDREFAEVEITGAAVQAASGRPMTKEDLLSRLKKTGDSLFTFSSLEIEADDNIFLPVSAVNTLRRQALSALQETILQEAKERRQEKEVSTEKAGTAEPEENCDHCGGLLTEEKQDHGGSFLTEEKGDRSGGLLSEEKQHRSGRSLSNNNKAERRGRQELWALVSTRTQMEAAVSAGCDCILNDGDFDPLGGNGKTGHSFLKKMRFICVLPPVFHVNNRERIRQQILTASEKGYSGILVRTLEELSLALQAGYEGEIIADASLYSWNGRSMAALSGECDRIVCPLELNQGGILDAIRAADQRQPAAQGRIMDKIILPVYGRIPMMESAGCVRKTENMCTRKDGFWYIEDRRGMQLPVRCRCGICSNTIYNAVPLSLHQFAGRGLYREAPVHLCMFTTENADQTREILQFFGSLRKESGSFPDFYGKKPSADPAVNGSAIKSGKVSGKTSEKISKKTSAKTSGNASGKASGKRGVTAEQKARAPFELFTNGHYKTGAL